jgi:MFS family permease
MALGLLAYCFACYAVVRGMQEAYAVFLLPLQGEFGWSRAQVSSVYSFTFFIVGVAGPFAGMLVDRWGSIRVNLLGIVLATSATALASQASALWQFYLTIGIMMGVAGSCVGFVPITALLSRWFRARLNTALAVAFSASGAGIFLMSPTTQLLIEWGGWRMAYVALACGLAVLLPVFLTFRWQTAQEGHPEFSGVRRSEANPVAGGMDLRGAFGSLAFWGMSVTFLFTSGAMFLVVLQTPAYLVHVGYSPREAAEAFGLLGLLLPAGMIGFGWLGDRIGRPRAILISYCLTIAGIFCLNMLVTEQSLLLLGLFIVMFGGTFGCRGPAMSTVAAIIFRGPHFGRIYGFITFWMGMGGAGGAWLGGYLYDVTGNYQTGFTTAMIFLVFGAAPFVMVRAIRQT